LRTFVDTSALYALLDEDDRNHADAAGWLAGSGRDAAEILVSHSYVVVETAALVHRRLGATAVRVLFEAFIPILSVLYVDEELHHRATSGYLAALRRRPSFVDWVSFQMMRDQSLDQALVFDQDFVTEGFQVVP
jgi:predicted nucleic acid-binding protein